MYICKRGHEQIVHKNDICPLCLFVKRNNELHNFIELKGEELSDQLVEYRSNNIKTGAPCLIIGSHDDQRDHGANYCSGCGIKFNK